MVRKTIQIHPNQLAVLRVQLVNAFSFFLVFAISTFTNVV
jgi:hypothetical protein